MKRPKGYPAVSPYLICPNAATVIEFLTTVLGAKSLRTYKNEDGSIMHAEVQIEESVVMIGNSGDQWPAIPTNLHVYVEDAMAIYKKALANGAESVREPAQQQGDSDLRGGFKDPGGNTWWVATTIND